MRAALIIEGEDYAYSPGSKQYLKATVLSPPSSGRVRIRIEHPDEHVPDRDEVVETRLIAGRWESEPETGATFSTDYRSESDDAPLMDRRKLTYREHAEKVYGKVVDQRDLVDRLAAVGIRRTKAHYADQGGQRSRRSIRNREGGHDLNLSRGELGHLLGIIEALKAQPVGSDDELYEAEVADPARSTLPGASG